MSMADGTNVWRPGFLEFDIMDHGLMISTDKGNNKCWKTLTSKIVVNKSEIFN